MPKTWTRAGRGPGCFTAWALFGLAGVLILPACNDWNQRSSERPYVRERSYASDQPRSAENTRRRTQDQTAATALAFPTGDRSTSALLVERTNPDEIVVGAPFQYQMRVTNLTNMPLNEVRLTETAGEGLEVTGGNLRPNEEGAPSKHDAASDARAKQDARRARDQDTHAPEKGATQRTWDLGTLGPRESKDIQVEARANRAGPISTCLAADYTPGACLTMNAVSPALQVKLEAPRQALSCEEIPLKYTVTNTGTGTARDVRIRTGLPQGFTSARGGDTAELTVGDIPAGTSREVTVAARADRIGEFAAKPRATGAFGLSSEAEPATIVVAQPTLQVAAKAPESQYLGREAGVEVVVTNTSNVAAQDVRVQATTSPNARLTNESTRDNAMTWDLGTLAPSEHKQLTLRLSTRDMGAVNGTVTATARCAPPAKADFRTEIVGVAALHMELGDSPDPVPMGSETTYTIRVVNQGNVPATNIRITAALPNEEEYVSGTGASDVNAPERTRGAGRTIQFAPLAQLAPKATAEWTLRVRAVGTGDVRFTGTMNSDQLTSPVEATESTHLIQ